MGQTVLTKQIELQNTEIKTALRRILDEVSSADAKVWNLRLDEVGVWTASVGASEGDTQTDTVMSQVKAVLARRGEAVTEALDLLDDLDAAYVGLRPIAADAADSVDSARARFDGAEAKVRYRLEHDPAVVTLANDERRMKALLDKNAEWEKDVEEVSLPRLEAYEKDPVFQYLLRRGYGTEDYKARWPISKLDARIAAWAGFATEKENLQAVIDYPEEYAKDMASLTTAYAAVPKKRAALILKIKDSLDPEREVLADALNDASNVVERFETARDTKTETVAKLRAYINGTDEEYKLITDAVIALTAKARTSAALQSNNGATAASLVAAQVDGLLKQRIAIARGADKLRQDALSILDRISEIQVLLDEAARREVGAEQFEFVLARTRVDLV